MRRAPAWLALFLLMAVWAVEGSAKHHGRRATESMGFAIDERAQQAEVSVIRRERAQARKPKAGGDGPAAHVAMAELAQGHDDAAVAVDAAAAAVTATAAGATAGSAPVAVDTGRDGPQKARRDQEVAAVNAGSWRPSPALVEVRGAAHGSRGEPDAWSDPDDEPNPNAPANFNEAEKEIEKWDKIVSTVERDAGLPDTTHTTKPPVDEETPEEAEEENTIAIALVIIGVSVVVICGASALAYWVYQQNAREEQNANEEQKPGGVETEDYGQEVAFVDDGAG